MHRRFPRLVLLPVHLVARQQSLLDIQKLAVFLLGGKVLWSIPAFQYSPNLYERCVGLSHVLLQVIAHVSFDISLLPDLDIEAVSIPDLLPQTPYALSRHVYSGLRRLLKDVALGFLLDRGERRGLFFAE
jgi:hypothetical protein